MKITSPSKKPQFSGSCVNKSHQLRLKDRLCGTGWKMRKRRSPHQSLMRKSSYKSLCSFKDSSHKKKISSQKLCYPIHRLPRKRSPKKLDSNSHRSAKSSHASWKSREKKSVRFKGSALKESASWKCRKKRSLSKNHKFDLHAQNSSPLKSDRAWKRRMKWQHPKKFLFDIFNWYPDITSSFTSPRDSSFFSGRECADAQLHQEFNGTTS